MLDAVRGVDMIAQHFVEHVYQGLLCNIPLLDLNAEPLVQARATIGYFAYNTIISAFKPGE